MGLWRFLFVLIWAASNAIPLHKYKRLSHDTLILGERPHPRNVTRSVRGYMFLHLDHDSELALAQKDLPPPVGKKLHFNKRTRSVARNQCAHPIAEGAVWKTSHGYFINAHNSQGLSSIFIETAVQRAFRRWACVVNGPGVERLVIGPLLGVRLDKNGDSIRHDSPDGFNEIGFAQINGKPGTIGLTVLWGDFEGSHPELVEFDMMFDQAHYRFGNSSEVRGVIDFEATATHEAGHAHGLDDIYEDSCSDVTMFATSNIDETKKRTLEQADIDGVFQMYEQVTNKK